MTAIYNNLKRIFPVLLMGFVFISNSVAQDNKPWYGKDCAVVLTYDDGLNVDLNNVIPALDSVGLKGTFYISDYFYGLNAQINKWRAAAAEGHELGNHTIWHPCDGSLPGRSFVKPDNDLNNYTVKRMDNEILAMNNFLKAIDGKSKRTFAYPCGDIKIHDSAYLEPIKNEFVAARGVSPEMLPADKINLSNVGCYGMNGQSVEDMIALVKKAMATHTLIVFLFHGVGGEHSLNVSVEAHSGLLHYLKQHEKEIWIAPMVDVAEYIKDSRSNSQQSRNDKGLKDYYKNYFNLGVAVSQRDLAGDEAKFILKNFNSLTPENAMKMGPIHPKENEYYWKDADSIVNFAQHNGLKVRGHNLCWHNQAPAWIFKDDEGMQVTKEVLLKRLKDHITTVVGRYKGKIYAWDVVNEAISDKPGEYLRNSLWYQVCGEEYIAKAFEYAHAADPAAILFYNDYNEINTEKREKIYRLVKSLKDAGVPINGIGLQGHWAVNEPSRAQLDRTFQKFASLGLTLQVTELDISVYPKEHNARERTAADADTVFSSEKENKQMEVYKISFELFRKYKNIISGVTFWNVSDKASWLDNFPVRRRKDYPLLFDKNLDPKKAFWGVVNF